MGTKSLVRLIDKCLFLVLTIFVLYVEWFQNAIGNIGGLIVLSGLAMGFLVVLRLMFDPIISRYKDVFAILLFVGYAMISGLVVSKYEDVFINMAMLTVQYVLPLIAVVVYIDGDRKKLKNILGVFVVAGVLLSQATLTNGVETETGAITLGNLNPNALATYLSLFLMSTIMLFIEAKNKILKFFLLAAMTLGLVVQINGASRRGFIVYLLMIFMFAYFLLRDKFRKTAHLKVATVIVAIIVLYVAYNYLMANSGSIVLIQRFLEENSLGDRTRESLQRTAIEMFEANPLFGMGLGAVSAKTGHYSHSMYHELLACTGIVGFLILVVHFVRIAFLSFNMWRSKQLMGEQRLESIMLVAFVIVILVSARAVVYIYDLAFYLIIALLISVRMTHLKTLKESNNV